MRQILITLTLGAALAFSASTAVAGSRDSDDSGLHSFPPAASASVALVGARSAAEPAGSNQAVSWIVEKRGENFDHR